MRRPSTLEIFEGEITGRLHAAIADENVRRTSDALVMSGLNHLRMGPGEWRMAFDEIWTGMHGRSGLENFGILALVAGYIAGGANDPLSHEHANAATHYPDQAAY